MDKFQFSDCVIQSNNQFLVAQKPFGVPVQDDPTEEESFLKKAISYCKHGLHIVTRLDRPVGGLVLFSKTSKAHKHFDQEKVKKQYLVVVEGVPKEEKGQVKLALTKSKFSKKAVIMDKASNTNASLEWEKLVAFDNYSLLSVSLESGKFHQVRISMKSIGHSIKGDVKYGARRANKDRSIHLLAYQIEFSHPISQKSEVFTATIPEGDSLWKATADHLSNIK